MHVFVLVLMMAVMAHDQAGAAPEPALRGWPMLAAVLVPYLLLAGFEWLGCRVTLVRLKRGAKDPIRRLDWLLAFIRAATLALFIADLYALGGLTALRERVGDWVLLDELIALAPPLITLLLGWSFYYPIDRHLREAARFATPPGESWPIGSRNQFILSQLRHQVLLVLVPLCAVLAWTEAVALWSGVDPHRRRLESALAFTGFAVIFAFAPVMIRFVWDTAPLPPGDLRDRLMALCRDYRVRVRSLLLWRTYGGMVNGAVMGAVGPLRYILLTDGLIARMTPFEIEAVMAHELAHVTKRHMVWLIVTAMAAIYALETFLHEAVSALEKVPGWDFPHTWPYWDTVVGVAILALVIPLWLLVFGWVSRRFERQADTFAVRHLSRRYPDPEVSTDRINGFAVQVYCEALRRVALMNHTPADRRSWRHGSIRWRMNYLETLIGTPLDHAQIDRVVRHICWTSATLLAALLLYAGTVE